jgi:hypothetical protein
MSGCFDLSGFYSLNNSQSLKYQFAWNTFRRIQSFNSNVSTLHKAGTSNNTLLYYTFASYDERNNFNIGQALHTQRYPNSNWNSVQQN